MNYSRTLEEFARALHAEAIDEVLRVVDEGRPLREYDHELAPRDEAQRVRLINFRQEVKMLRLHHAAAVTP